MKAALCEQPDRAGEKLPARIQLSRLCDSVDRVNHRIAGVIALP